MTLGKDAVQYKKIKTKNKTKQNKTKKNTAS